MKNNFLFLLVVFCLTTPFYGQNTFKYDHQGLQPKYVVVSMDGKDQAALYKKAVNWAQTDNRTLNDSEEPNKITFQGEKANALCYTVMGKTSCNNLRYTVEVAFKDNKYKFQVIRLEQFGPINDTGKKGWFDVDLDKAPDAYYTRSGELKKEYVATPGNISDLFNNLNEEFKSGVLKEKAAEEDDGWK